MCRAPITLAGVEKGRFFITTDMQTELFRAATAAGGSVPGHNWLLERVLSLIALIGLPIWRLAEADRKIRAHAPEHANALALPSKPPR